MQFLLFHKHTALMGLEGLWGYAISSHINNLTAIHNMHAFFLSPFSSHVYFYSPETAQISGFKPASTNISECFVGITILFSTKPSRLSWATVYRRVGLDCYSGQRQFRESRFKFLNATLAERGPLGPNWTSDPVRVCVFECICVVLIAAIEMLLNVLQLLCKRWFCRTVCLFATTVVF